MQTEKMNSHKSLRVLIIEDEEEFALTLASRLELRGMLVHCAFGGKEGLALMEKSLPDILLLDMRMPGFSGVDVLRALRLEKKIPGGEKLPVILVSGHAEEEDFREAEKMGIQGYVAKPVHFDELLEKMATALQ